MVTSDYQLVYLIWLKTGIVPFGKLDFIEPKMSQLPLPNYLF